jgi:antitoxin component YwqK of YwqJK toxin-antitoxin module
MKGILFILVIASVACTGKIRITEEEIMPDIFYAEGGLKPFTGQCAVVDHNSDLILEQFTYRNGVLHGKALVWYKNGKMKRRGSYRNGKMTGLWEFWDVKGNQTLVVNFENDKLNGQFTSLEPDGRIKEKGIYTANRRTGAWTSNIEEVIIKSEIPDQH